MKKSFSSISIFTLAALGIMLLGSSCASSKSVAKNASSKAQNVAEVSSQKKIMLQNQIWFSLLETM